MPESRVSRTTDTPKGSRSIQLGLLVLHVFVSLGALYGGGLLSLFPDGSALGTPLEMLRYTPFPDFRIPGLILFWVIGVGHMVAGIAIMRHPARAWLLTAVMGLVLMGWIVIQVLLIRGSHGVHFLYFGLGLVICGAGVSLWPRMKSRSRRG